MIRLTALVLAFVGLSACDIDSGVPASGFGAPNLQSGVTSRATSVAPLQVPSDAAANQFAVSFLNTIQARSIAERREYCGYFFVDQTGQLRATVARPGTFASCEMPVPRPGQGIYASYHTHGAYGRGFDNEVPSSIDLMSDFRFGLDGYVSTPGGRVWHVDNSTQSTRQICGLKCVISDPGFVPDTEAGMRQQFSLSDLQKRAAQF